MNAFLEHLMALPESDTDYSDSGYSSSNTEYYSTMKKNDKRRD